MEAPTDKMVELFNWLNVWERNVNSKKRTSEEDLPSPKPKTRRKVKVKK